MSHQLATRTKENVLPDQQSAGAQGKSMAPPSFQLQANPIQRAASSTVAFGGKTHTVVAGDNLWNIAKNTYGSGRFLKVVIDANAAQTNNGKKLLPGMVLDLPKVDVPIGSAIDDRKASPEELRDLAVALPEADYDAYLSGLSGEQVEKDGNFLQGLDMMRSTGMTFEEMTAEQRKFMEAQAKAEGKTIGEFIGGEVATRGYGGGTATEWNALKKSEKTQYHLDFKKIVKDIKASAPQDVKDVVTNAEKHGGGFVWDPVECEKNGALAYTQSDWKLHAGKAWVDAAKKDVSIVFGNIVHEMGGHNEYGEDDLGWKIANGVINGLPSKEKKKATEGSNSPYSAYGYMESELWSELREDPHDRVDSPSDHPFEKAPGTGDVEDKLVDIKKVFEPKIAEALVKSIWKRAKLDNRITADTRTKFQAKIKKVFALDVK